jgi:hypothetical protein
VNVPILAVKQRNHNAQMANGGIPREMVHAPDRELIACLVANGQPAWSAAEVSTNPQVRMMALKFWLDVQDSAEGDLEARQRVDYIRAGWVAMRRAELIADDPRRVTGDLVDPHTLL